MLSMGLMNQDTLLTRRWKSKITAALFLFAMVGALGTTTAVAVEVSPQCHRIVKTYTTRLKKNVVSPGTLRAWQRWGVGHPNWKPNPNVKRPKYKRVPVEDSSLLDVACPVVMPEIPTDEIALLSPDIPQYDLPAIDTPDFNVEGRVPTLVAGVPPGVYPQTGGFAPVFGGLPGVGIPGGSTGTGGTTVPPTGPGTGGTTVPPVIPPTPAPVPEPASIVLALSGAVLAGAKKLFAARRA